MAKICSGCGTQIQSSDPKRPGYVPPELLSRENVICQRCYKISHYNQLTPDINPDHFNNLLKKIGQEKALVVKIIDLFDFNGTMLPGFARLMRFNPIVVAVNKIDLLPRVNWGRIKEWIKRQIETLGMKPVDLVFVSGANGSGIRELLSAIRNHRQGRDVYLVGAANVGKSTLINQILNYIDQEADLKLTTSRFPGTTLDLIAIPLKDGTLLYDTPGVISGEQMTHYLSAEDLKLVLPQKPLKPKIYQLNPQQTLFFGGLARLALSQVCAAHLFVIWRTPCPFIDPSWKGPTGYIVAIWEGYFTLHGLKRYPTGGHSRNTPFSWMNGSTW